LASKSPKRSLIIWSMGGAQRGQPSEPGRSDIPSGQTVPELGRKLGRLVAQLAPKRNDRLVVTYGGKATQLPTDPVTRAVLKGFLQSAAAAKSTRSTSARWPPRWAS